MWWVACLLLLGVAAQPGYPPCGLLGIWANFSGGDVSPEVPSLTDMISFSTGCDDTQGNWTVALEYDDMTVFYPVLNVTYTLIPNLYVFDATLRTKLPGPNIIPSGIYKYHIYYSYEMESASAAFNACFGESTNTVSIGMTLPVTNIDYQWIYNEKSQPTNLTLTGTNNSLLPLNWVNCDILIVSIDKELDPVNCEVTDVLPGANFNTTMSITGLPNGLNGLYIARIYMSTATHKPVGYVEVAVQIGEFIDIDIIEFNDEIVIQNTGSTTYNLGRVTFTSNTCDKIYTINEHIWTNPVALPGFGSLHLPVPDMLACMAVVSTQIDVFDESNTLISTSSLDIHKSDLPIISDSNIYPTDLPLNGAFFIDISGYNLDNLSVTIYAPDCNYTLTSSSLYSNSTFLTLVIHNITTDCFFINPAFVLVTSGSMYPIYSLMVFSRNDILSIEDIDIVYPEQLVPNGFVEMFLIIPDLDFFGSTCDVWLGSGYDALMYFGTFSCSYIHQTVWLPVVKISTDITQLPPGGLIMQLVTNDLYGESQMISQGYIFIQSDSGVVPYYMSLFPTTIYQRDSTLTLYLKFQGDINSNLLLHSLTLYTDSNRTSVPATLQSTVLPANSQITMTLSAVQWPVIGDYTLGICLQNSDSSQILCWETDTTLFDSYRLQVTKFTWSRTNTTFNFTAFLQTNEETVTFSQSFCRVVFSPQDNYTFSTLVGLMGPTGRNTAMVDSDPIPFPTQGDSGTNITLQFLSKDFLLNGEYTFGLEKESKACIILLGFWLLISY